MWGRHNSVGQCGAVWGSVGQCGAVWGRRNSVGQCGAGATAWGRRNSSSTAGVQNVRTRPQRGVAACNVVLQTGAAAGLRGQERWAKRSNHDRAAGVRQVCAVQAVLQAAVIAIGWHGSRPSPAGLPLTRAGTAFRQRRPRPTTSSRGAPRPRMATTVSCTGALC